MRSRNPSAQRLQDASPAPMTVRRPPQVGQTTWNKLGLMGGAYPLSPASNGKL